MKIYTNDQKKITKKIEKTRKSRKFKITASQQTESLGLLLLMQQSDKNDVVSRDEIIKALE